MELYRQAFFSCRWGNENNLMILIYFTLSCRHWYTLPLNNLVCLSLTRVHYLFFLCVCTNSYIFFFFLIYTNSYIKKYTNQCILTRAHACVMPSVSRHRILPRSIFQSCPGPTEAPTVQISFHHWVVLPALELHVSGIILCALLCSTVFNHNVLSCLPLSAE